MPRWLRAVDQAIFPLYRAKQLLIPLSFIIFLTIALTISRPLLAQYDNEAGTLITEADFWELLAKMSTDSAQGKSIEQGINRLSLIETIETIESASGERWPIKKGELAQQLREHADPTLLLEQWLALHEASTATAQPNATAALTTILAQPQFQYAPEANFLQKLLRRFLNWLFSAFDFIPRSSAIWQVIIGGVAAALLAIFLWYWLRSMRRQFSAETSTPLNPHAHDLGLSASGALQQAHNQADEGNLREAVRYLYLSTLLNLDERNLLRYDRSKTNREYLRQVTNTPFAPTLNNVVDMFDRVWYGFQPIDQTTYQHYAAQVEELLQ